MKITIIAVGKIKESFIKDGIAEYSKRLSRYCNLEIIEVEDEPAPEKLSKALESRVKKLEGERVTRVIPRGAFVIMLDVKGVRLSSEALAQRVQELGVNGVGSLCFIIGGSLGLQEEVLKSADFKFSMSDLTFTHQFARIILLEQIYRAFKIIRGEIYHK